MFDWKWPNLVLTQRKKYFLARSLYILIEFEALIKITKIIESIIAIRCVTPYCISVLYKSRSEPFGLVHLYR